MVFGHPNPFKKNYGRFLGHRARSNTWADPKKCGSALKFMQIMINMSTGMIKKQKRSILLFKLCKNINHSQSYGCFSVYFW